MTWDHPLFLWAVPVVAFLVAAFGLRVPGHGGRRVARFVARTAVLACAIAALAGPATTQAVPRARRLVLAVDAASRTPLADASSGAAALWQEALRDVAAAESLTVEVLHYTTRPGGPDEAPPVSAQSVLAAGLAGSRLRFEDDETGGVIVIADGRGDLSGTRSAVEALRADAIATTGVAVPATLAPPEDRARIEAFEAPATARGPFLVRTRVHVPGAAAHRLLLHADGQVAQTVERAPPAGTDPGPDADILFDALELPPGLHEISLTIEIEGKVHALARRLVEVGAPPRVLGLLREASWVKALEVQGLPVERVEGASLRGLLSGGRVPDLVLADAESLLALPADAAHLLRERVLDGLGLTITAGADPAAWAALARGPLSDLLPLTPEEEPPKPPPPAPPPQADPPPPIDKPEEAEGPGLKAERRPEEALPITLLLLVDRSGSMAVPIAKLEMAILGAQRAAEALSPWDRVGVISFASDVRIDIPVRSARTASTLAAWLSGVEPDPRAGTNIAGALRLARRVMERERSPIKHVILLTDGRQYPSGPIFGPVVKPMRRMGITITAVGIGRGANMAQLREIVQWAARGHVRSARSPAQIPRILTRDTERVAEERRVNAEKIDARLHDDRANPEPTPSPTDQPAPLPPPRGPEPAEAKPPTKDSPAPAESEATAPLPVLRVRAHEALRGFAADEWPAVGMPRKATVPPGAAVLLARSDGTPVLAAARHGVGRVLIWALPPTDPGALAWAPLGRLFAQTARSALAPEGAFEFLPKPRVRQTGDGATLHVVWPTGASTGHVDARWIGPDGTPIAVGVFTPGDGDAGRPLPAAATGARCRIELSLPGGPTPATLTYLVAAAQEAAPRPADARALATALGGPLENPVAFARALPVLSRTEGKPRWALFLWLAVLLLPLDVFLHRRTPTR